MMATMRLALLLLTALAPAAAIAEAPSDYRLRAGTATLEARHALVPKLDGQREALGSGTIRVLCFFEGSSVALILRVDDRFYALNGTARDAAKSAEIEWSRRRYSIADPYSSKLPQSDYMERMIGPANRGCQQ